MALFLGGHLDGQTMDISRRYYGKPIKALPKLAEEPVVYEPFWLPGSRIVYIPPGWTVGQAVDRLIERASA